MTTSLLITKPFPCTVCGALIDPGEWQDHMAEAHYFIPDELHE